MIARSLATATLAALLLQAAADPVSTSTSSRSYQNTKEHQVAQALPQNIPVEPGSLLGTANIAMMMLFETV